MRRGNAFLIGLMCFTFGVCLRKLFVLGLFDDFFWNANLVLLTLRVVGFWV